MPNYSNFTAALLESTNFYPAEKPLVLIVDDDKFMRLQIRQCLKQDDYQIVEAVTGKEALVAYQQTQPNLILMDARMPEMDGFTCCLELQSLPNSEYTPVLMITSLEDQSSVDRAFAAGAVDFVTKPIHWAVLRQRVKRLLHQTFLLKQLEAANQKLSQMATVDGLTQIPNRRCFDETLEVEWRRQMREHQWLSLILCDVDYFKPFNDTYGHQAGDLCLQQVAQVLQQTLKRSSDLVARYGGEEFAVILPATDLVGAIQLAEQLRSAVQVLNIPHRATPLDQTVTLSLGVAALIPTENTSLNALITAADQALYKAKARGRNCVVGDA